MCKLFNQTDVFSATFVVMAGTPINLLNIVCNVYTVLDKCVYLIYFFTIYRPLFFFRKMFKSRIIMCVAFFLFCCNKIQSKNQNAGFLFRILLTSLVNVFFQYMLSPHL